MTNHATIRWPQPDPEIFRRILRVYWYAPYDCLQRSAEATLLGACRFAHPILDIGIGNGGISTLIFPSTLKVDMGIDLDPSGIAQALRTKRYKKAQQEDAQNMSFKNGTFATVIANSTFEHIEDDKKAVKEVARVLKKGGTFFMTVPSPNLEKWILAAEEGNDAKQKLQEYNTRVWHLHYRSLQEWRKLFAAAGFTSIQIIPYFSKGTFDAWYHLTRLGILKVGKREVWSWLGASRLTPLIPKNIVQSVIQQLLSRPYAQSLNATNGQGAMFCIMAKKK